MSSSDPGKLNFNRSTKERPYHLSVGGVVHNNEGEILTRHFSNFKGRDTDMYLFPTETIEPSESLEQALLRGLKEEVGVTAEIKGFLGTLVGFAKSNDKIFEKTVIYFLTELKSISLPQYPDEDGASTVEWHTPEFLLEQTKYLPQDMIHSVLNESSIIKAAQKILSPILTRYFA